MGQLMKPQDLDLKLLVVLQALLEERNATRAAKRLSLSQPSISYYLRQLREVFHDPLFLRTNTGLEPTAAALALSVPVAEALRIIDQKILATVAFDAASIERITIATSDIGEVVIMPTLSEWASKRLSNAVVRNVELSDETLLTRMETGEIDIALCSSVSAPNYDALYQQRLYTYDYVGLVARRSSGVDIERLVREGQLPAIILASPREKKKIHTALSEHGILLSSLFAGARLVSIPLLLDDHDAFAIAPRAFAQRLHSTMLVRMFELPITLPSFSIYQYWHRRFHHDARMKWIRESVAELLMNNDA